MNILVALFDTETAARDAMNALINIGTAPADIAFSPDKIPPSAVEQDRSHTEAKNFFDTLFSGDVEYASACAAAVADGMILLAVAVKDHTQLATAEEILLLYEPVEVVERVADDSQWLRANGNGATETIVLPVIEEQFSVGKRTLERGGVRVIQRMTGMPVTENVTLRQENVVIARLSVDRPASISDLDAMKDRSFDVTATTEEAIARKEARTVEEIVIAKAVENRTEIIRDTVRKTEVEIEPIGLADRRLST